ncbi:MAG: polysaccharide biosynthesis protein, partial [Sphingopyxis sp.]|nr:polysaccharide biosynthesis protein [Sphingopyxis sp.]
PPAPLPLAAVLAAGSGPLLALFGAEARAATAAVIIMFAARAAEAVLGISLPVLQVVAAFRHQLAASITGLAAAALTGWLVGDWLPPLTAVTLAVAVGLVTSAAVPMVQLWRIEALHPVTPAFPRVAGVASLIAAVGALLALVASSLPDAAALPFITLIAAASIWLSLRFALTRADRRSLGKAAHVLRLI